MILRRITASALCALALQWAAPAWAQATQAAVIPNVAQNAAGAQIGPPVPVGVLGFQPDANSPGSVGVTTTSSATALGARGGTVIVHNTGTASACIAIAPTVACPAAEVPAGETLAFSYPPGASLAAVTASGSTSLVLTTGLGLPVLTGGGGSGGAVTNAGTFAVQVTSAAGQPALNGDGGSLAHVTNFPSTQPVSGSVSLSGSLPGFATTPTFNCGTGCGGGAVTVTSFPADNVVNGSVFAATAANTFNVPITAGDTTLAMQVTGLTASGAALAIQWSPDNGATWQPLNEIAVAGAFTNAITADGPFRFNIAGRQQVRLLVTTAGTGTITVSTDASTAVGPHPIFAGANAFADCAIFTIGCQGDAAAVTYGQVSSAMAQLKLLNEQVAQPLAPQTYHGALIGAVEGNGTAGSPDTHVFSMQGVSGGTPVSVAQSGSALPYTTSAMTGTASTQLVPGTASVHLYLSEIDCNNSSTTTTLVTLQDGSGGTALRTLICPAGSGEVINFSPPLREPTAGNGFYVADVTTGASVIVNAAVSGTGP